MFYFNEFQYDTKIDSAMHQQRFTERRFGYRKIDHYSGKWIYTAAIITVQILITA